jgi:hypothetical protein
MGAEARCTARYRGAVASGTARLETAALQFRGGQLSVSVPFTAISTMQVAEAVLSVDTPDGELSLDLGPAAERWMTKIRHPPSRLQKLGVRPEWRVSVIGINDDCFVQEIAAVVVRLSVGRVIKESDAIFFGANHARQLTRIGSLKTSLKQNGGLRIVRPKGQPDISERAVMTAGRTAGLVDVKVVSFSPTHTVQKFVIPRSKRLRQSR